MFWFLVTWSINKYMAAADPRDPGAPLPPMAQNYLNFMQFFGNFGKNYMLAPQPPPLWRVAAPS